MTDAIEWPRELWMAEREEHDQGVISGVLSEHATVARWEGDKERDREFHRYVDADIYESADRYWRERCEKAESQFATARADALREAAEIARSKVHSGTGESAAVHILALIDKETDT